jgi:hypothetical protein
VGVVQGYELDQRRHSPGNGLTLAQGMDAALAVGAGGIRLARLLGRPVGSVTGAVLRFGGRVPPVAFRRALVAELAADGAVLRVRLERAAAELFRILLRHGVEVALTTIDLTDLVRRHLDLDAVAGDLDVDAVIRRTDLVAVVDRMDLDAIVAGIDLDAIVGRIDIDSVVKTVDLDAVMARLDLDAVLSRIDLNEVAARIDLDSIIQRVEPDAVVARVDIEAVIGRLDLVAITREVIAAIDLPAIVHQSSGAVSSQAARVVRAEGMSADESVSRFVDRVLRRPHPRGAVTP